MDLSLLRRRFLSCSPVGEIWTKDIIKESTQQDILLSTVLCECLKGRPLSQSYTNNFMKTFMHKIEEFGGEIYDCTYEAYGDILSLSAPTVEHRHYDLSDTTICLQESGSLVAEGTTGLKTWQASQYLAEYLLANKSLVEGKKVLELGCGLGFLGLAICAACRCGSYILSDHHSSVLQKLHANIAINEEKLLCIPNVEEIDWNIASAAASSPSQLHGLDIILAADVVFDKELIPSLVKCIEKLVSSNSQCQVLIASTIRNPDTYASFSQAVGDTGFQRKQVVSNATKLFVYDESSEIVIDRVSKASFS
ncbi:protein-lysine N-methyltransferase EEF2KMT-like [Watersipora subatra]|uniref:protein-lysine N-methyltransferase EEF2KMT-like n=1 Tax=Watersipora subatra TaxID=2589382 RepID=UPI00355C974A